MISQLNDCFAAYEQKLSNTNIYLIRWLRRIAFADRIDVKLCFFTIDVNIM